VSINRSDNEGNKKYNDILELLAANKISLDLINIFPDKQIFTINKTDKEIVETLLSKDNFKYSILN
ncbi:Aspartokinase, partial [human gut metagenome]